MKRLVIAALPRELQQLTRGWERVASEQRGVAVWRHRAAVAACAGIGRERATLAFQAGLAAGGADAAEVISFGLAGACAEEARVGDAFWCGTVVDSRSGERFGRGSPVLVTAGAIAGVAEKRRLRESYGASLVDMEAATLARLAEARTMRFRALKGVSDGPEMAIEGTEQFVTEQGAFREARFAMHVAVRPRLWRTAMALGKASATALRRATAMLEEDLREG